MNYPMVNIIHDPRRPEKKENIIAEMSRQGIKDYIIWDAVEDVNSVVSSISKSHKQIIQHAKENYIEEVIIMEDDCYFPAEDGFKHFIKKRPKWLWMLYLGGAYSVQIEKTSSGWDCVKQFFGLHCYIAHCSIYNLILSAPEHLHIDTWLSDQVKHLCASVSICMPMAAIQRKGWSENNKGIADYNLLLKEEDVYGGLPR